MDANLNLNDGVESDDSEAEEQVERSSKKKDKGKGKQVLKRKGQVQRKLKEMDSESETESETGSESGSETGSESRSETGSGSGSEDEEVQQVKEKGHQETAVEGSVALYEPAPVDGPAHLDDGPAHLDVSPTVEESMDGEEEGRKEDKRVLEMGNKVVSFQREQQVAGQGHTGFSQLAQVIQHQNPDKIIFVSNCSGTFNF